MQFPGDIKLPPPPAQNSVDIDVTSAKILGVKTYNISIFDAWKNKGVVLKQPFAKYEPPKSLGELIKSGIAASLAKKSEEINNAKSNLKNKEELTNILDQIKNMKKIVHPSYEAIQQLKTEPIGTLTPPRPPLPPEPLLTAGGAQFSLSDITNALSGGLGKITNWITNGFDNVMSNINNAWSDVKRVWDALLNLSNLVNDIYDFMHKWKDEMEQINSKIMGIENVNQTLTNLVHQEVLNNREFYSKISELMSSSLSKYFDDLTFHLLRYGQVDIPTAVVGSVTLSVKNKTPMPLVVTIPDLEIKSSTYTLHKGPYVVNMMPFENDSGDVPFNVYGVDEAKYLLERKKEGTLPINLTGTITTPMGTKKINITKVVRI